MFGSRSSRSRISPGASSFARAAASSIASGSPSSCLQTRATSGALAVSSSNSGSTACARAAKRRTASVLTSASNGRSALGISNGGTGYSRSAASRNGARLVARIHRRGAAASRSPTKGAAERICSKLSSTSSIPPLAQMLDHALGQVPLTLAHVERLRDRRHQELRARGRREADEQRTVAELGLELVRDCQPDSRLARASGAGEGDEPCALVAEQRADRCKLEAAADERRGRHRQRLRSSGLALPERRGSGPAGGSPAPPPAVQGSDRGRDPPRAFRGLRGRPRAHPPGGCSGRARASVAGGTARDTAPRP